eukprot:CAMPEP_0206481386 /NCGR_PEP_ID=MMETSP0324_2-20121206/38111_1 /ASSEMBLY_ACC=CAM_ASM_000836 /TAXON_ID=2866 /ORGANISM="Crypthecodinium cohnii, Strain Seligo" /LENGTH=93 /DNA_ID=CAMNT_0053958859 /DNA_START=531 /DNA_END=812 /DNA_ORIENTATION=-
MSLTFPGFTAKYSGPSCKLTWSGRNVAKAPLDTEDLNPAMESPSAKLPKEVVDDVRAGRFPQIVDVKGHWHRDVTSPLDGPIARSRAGGAHDE